MKKENLINLILAILLVIGVVIFIIVGCKKGDHEEQTSHAQTSEPIAESTSGNDDTICTSEPVTTNVPVPTEMILFEDNGIKVYDDFTDSIILFNGKTIMLLITNSNEFDLAVECEELTAGDKSYIAAPDGDIEIKAGATIALSIPLTEDVNAVTFSLVFIKTSDGTELCKTSTLTITK